MLKQMNLLRKWPMESLGHWTLHGRRAAVPRRHWARRELNRFSIIFSAPRALDWFYRNCARPAKMHLSCPTEFGSGFWMESSGSFWHSRESVQQEGSDEGLETIETLFS